MFAEHGETLAILVDDDREWWFSKLCLRIGENENGNYRNSPHLHRRLFVNKLYQKALIGP